LERPIKVRILEHEYLIKGEEDSEQVERIARFVNEKFKEVKESTEGLSERRTAILVAFDIASEYFQTVEAQEKLLEEFRRRARVLNDRIDRKTKVMDSGLVGKPPL